MKSKEQRYDDRPDIMAYFFEKYEKANFDAKEKLIELFRKL